MYYVKVQDENQAKQVLKHNTRYPAYPRLLGFDEAENFVNSFDAPEFEIRVINDLVMDFDKIKIVHCSGKEEVRELFLHCEGWAHDAFQRIDDWLNTSWFIVEKNRICRWFPDQESAVRAFPWTPIVSPSVFGLDEDYSLLSLEEVLDICR